MSVIVECPDKKIRMFSKGADSAIKSKIKLNPEYLQQANDALVKFARSGLRTLMIAFKEINRDDYDQFNKEYFVKYLIK